MLLFGGTLSTPAAKQNLSTQVKTEDSAAIPEVDQRGHQSSTAKTSVTPHTDVLHRLTNHELRLLEELERTRSKLQSEWRLKLVDLQRQQPDAIMPLNVSTSSSTSDTLVQRMQIPRESTGAPKSSTPSKTMSRGTPQKAAAHKKPPRRSHDKTDDLRTTIPSSSLPRIIRPTQNMMSILTTTGETPFEVGLESGDSEANKISQTQHVLPIFRLPSVNVTGAARALVTSAVETFEEDRERKQASEALGFSLEEIEQFEANLKGHGSGKNSHSLNQVPSARSNSQDPQGSSIGTRKVFAGRRSPNLNRQKPINRSTKPQGQSRRESLRSELESALNNVHNLTRLVKNDISLAQKICPTSDLRTTLYFKRWGREKVENIFRRLLFNLQGVAFERWKAVVSAEMHQEKMQAYLMYKGSKKLDMFLLNWSQRKLRQAWTKWWSDFAHQKALERSALEKESIRTIQRAWRGYRGRMLFRTIKAQKLLMRQTSAAVKMQRMFRGSIARKFLRLKRMNKRKQCMATRIQALARGYLARTAMGNLRQERRMHKASSKVQALYRGRKVRREIEKYHQVRRLNQAAILIQRRYRGRLGRAKYIRQQIERHRERASVKIQTRVRSWLAYRLLGRLREDARKEAARRNAAAVNIQKVYRGHRARLATELKLIALREKNRWRAQAATKIQRLVRFRQARRKVDMLRQERFAELVAQSRRWVEYWNEDSSKWFYYNQETGEALWAPPPTGYTKADGTLVLQDGRITDDPGDGDFGSALAAIRNPLAAGGQRKPGEKLSGDVGEDETDGDDDKLCIECEEEDARRRCNQCEDVFCDGCYEKLHQSAKRRQHTWKAIGSMRCIECEKMKATRWCSECQDPYCLGCFTIIHSKGNKSTHKWTDMATFKRSAKLRQQVEDESAQTYDEFVQSTEYQYVTELAQAQAAAPPAGNYEWAYLIDESSGLPYYYNSATGESRWA